MTSLYWISPQIFTVGTIMTGEKGLYTETGPRFPVGQLDQSGWHIPLWGQLFWEKSITVQIYGPLKVTHNGHISFTLLTMWYSALDQFWSVLINDHIGISMFTHMNSVVLYVVKSMGPSDAYMRRQPRPSLNNGLSPCLRQVMAGTLLIWPSGTNVSEMSI